MLHSGLPESSPTPGRCCWGVLLLPQQGLAHARCDGEALPGRRVQVPYTDFEFVKVQPSLQEGLSLRHPSTVLATMSPP